MYEFISGEQSKFISGDTSYDGTTKVSFAKDRGLPFDTNQFSKQAKAPSNLNFLYSGGFGCLKETDEILNKLNEALDDVDNDNTKLKLDDIGKIYNEDILMMATKNFISELLKIPSRQTKEDADEILGVVLDTILSSVDTQNIPDKYNVTKR